jgi:Ankyrin repeats (3 copies)
MRLSTRSSGFRARSVKLEFHAAIEFITVAPPSIAEGSSSNAQESSPSCHLLSRMSTLRCAAASGDVKELRRILKYCTVDINAVNADWQTPLHCAAQMGQHAAVQCLLALGADASRADVRGRTALHLSCRAHDAKATAVLASTSGCDINVTDRAERSAVHYACWSGDVASLKHLRANGAAELNVKTKLKHLTWQVRCWKHESESSKYKQVEAYLNSLRFGVGVSSKLTRTALQRALGQAADADKVCCICMDSGDYVKLCITCSTGEHSLCSECLQQFVLSEVTSNKQHIAAASGLLRCPSPGCRSAPFDQHTLAQQLPKATFARYLAAWQQCIEQQAMQLAAEQARVQQAAKEALDAAARARQHIIDSILTLQCPRCGKAFEDFDGCFALTCRDTAGNGCNTHFCEFCFDISALADAHTHVTVCPYNTNARKGLFGRLEVFIEAQRVRRQRLTHQYLDTLDAAVRGRALAAVEHELHDIGIDVEALRGPWTAPAAAAAVPAAARQAVTAQAAAAEAAAPLVEGGAAAAEVAAGFRAFAAVIRAVAREAAPLAAVPAAVPPAVAAPAPVVPRVAAALEAPAAAAAAPAVQRQ